MLLDKTGPVMPRHDCTQTAVCSHHTARLNYKTGTLNHIFIWDPQHWSWRRWFLFSISCKVPQTGPGCVFIKCLCRTLTWTFPVEAEALGRAVAPVRSVTESGGGGKRISLSTVPRRHPRPRTKNSAEEAHCSVPGEENADPASPGPDTGLRVGGSENRCLARRISSMDSL